MISKLCTYVAMHIFYGLITTLTSLKLTACLNEPTHSGTTLPDLIFSQIGYAAYCKQQKLNGRKLSQFLRIFNESQKFSY